MTGSYSVVSSMSKSNASTLNAINNCHQIPWAFHIKKRNNSLYFIFRLSCKLSKHLCVRRSACFRNNTLEKRFLSPVEQLLLPSLALYHVRLAFAVRLGMTWAPIKTGRLYEWRSLHKTVARYIPESYSSGDKKMSHLPGDIWRIYIRS